MHRRGRSGQSAGSRGGSGDLMRPSAVPRPSGIWSFALPAFYFPLAMMLALIGCTPATNTTAISPVAASSTDARMEAFLAVQEMRARLMTACTETDPSRMGVTSPYFVGYVSDIKTCFREKLTAAFVNSEGIVHCAAKPDLGDYAVCISMGDWLNMLRRGAGLPGSLSVEEWQDLDMAMKHTAEELSVQSFATCTGTADAQRWACHSEIFAKSFDIPPSDVALCRGDIFLQMRCIGYKAVARYLRDKAMLIW